MPIHAPVNNTGIYFITFTCHKWLPLIGVINGYDLVYKWFDVLSAWGHSVTGFVIMPNHLHLLLHYCSNEQSLNTVVANGKRFMAYDIIRRLGIQQQNQLLTNLAFDVCPSDRKRGKKHEVWIGSFDVKHCRTEKFLLQKLHYIHNNPCTGKWKLAKCSIDYPHSSARFYFNGQIWHYPVKDYHEFLYWDKFEG